jgi:hypothetical protein
MKLMELLTEEQQHLITEVYTVTGQDAVRFQIIHESYEQAHRDYENSVTEHTINSRQAQNYKTKLEQYITLYNDFVVEMDKHYGNKK